MNKTWHWVKSFALFIFGVVLIVWGHSVNASNKDKQSDDAASEPDSTGTDSESGAEAVTDSSAAAAPADAATKASPQAGKRNGNGKTAGKKTLQDDGQSQPATTATPAPNTQTPAKSDATTGATTHKTTSGKKDSHKTETKKAEVKHTDTQKSETKPATTVETEKKAEEASGSH